MSTDAATIGSVVTLPPLADAPATTFMPGLLSGSVAMEPVTGEVAAASEPQAEGDTEGRDTVAGGRSLRGRRNRRRRGGRGRDAQGQLLAEGSESAEGSDADDAAEGTEESNNTAVAAPTADAAPAAEVAVVVAAPVAAPVRTPRPAPEVAPAFQPSAAIIQAAMDTPAGRPRPAPAAPREEAAPAPTPVAVPVIVARAEEVTGERMPRLIASGDGDLDADAPQILSENSPLTATAPKNFAPRLIASGDGAPTSLPVMSASPQTAPTAAAGNFMPRLIVSGREDSRARRERPAPAAPLLVDTSPAESLQAGESVMEVAASATAAPTIDTEGGDKTS